MHEILDYNTVPRLLDVRKTPERFSYSYGQYRFLSDAAVYGTTCRSLRLVSHEFPWMIEVRPSMDGFVTCFDVLYQLYHYLNSDMKHTDWALVLEQKEEIRNAIQKTTETRLRTAGDGAKAKRVDWLVKNVYFRGLIKDDEFAKKRLPPGESLAEHTYVVKLVECTCLRASLAKRNDHSQDALQSLGGKVFM